MTASTPLGTGGRRDALLLLLVGAALALPRLGAVPFERAEIYFLDVARAMVESGDWLVPRYRGEPFFDKPPLTYWLVAGALWLGGFDLAAARLVPAGAALGTLLATLALGRQLFGGREALAGALTLATSLVFMHFARIAMSDMLMCFASMLLVALAMRIPASGPASRWLLPAIGAVAGLAFLTKGPLAVLLPGLGIASLCAARGSRPLRLRAAEIAAGVVLFAVLGLGWFAAVWARAGLEPLGHFFVHENLQRFSGTAYDSGRPVTYYLLAYLGMGSPWSLFLPAALWRLHREQATADRRAALGLAAWIGLGLVPLSLARFKADYYLLPLLPPASLLVGRFLAGRPWDTWDRRWVRAVLFALAVAAAVLAAAPPLLPADWLPGPVVLAGLRGVAGGLALASLAVVLRPQPWRVIAVIASGAAAAFLAVMTLLLPAFAEGQPNRHLLRDIVRERAARPGARVVACRDELRLDRDLLFRLRTPLLERCDLESVADSAEPVLMVLRPEDLERAAGGGRLRVVAEYAYLPANLTKLRRLLEEGASPSRIALVVNY